MEPTALSQLSKGCYDLQPVAQRNAQAKAISLSCVLRRLADLRDQGVRIFYGHDGEFWRSVPQAESIR